MNRDEAQMAFPEEVMRSQLGPQSSPQIRNRIEHGPDVSREEVGHVQSQSPARSVCSSSVLVLVVLLLE